jgi:hypothetical protein
MTLTLSTAYTTAVNANLNGSGRLGDLLVKLGSAIDIPNGAQLGVVSVNVITAFTAGTGTDGTMATNGLNNTVASMTLVDNQTVSSVSSKQKESGMLKGKNAVKIANGMADALGFKAIDTLIEGLVSATPSSSNTMTAGKANFAGATQTEIAILTKALTDVAVNRGADYRDLVILVYPTAFSNLTAAASTILNNPMKLTAGPNGDDLWTFMGVPMYPAKADSATNWGAASKPCLFVVHPEGYALKFTPAFMHGGGPIAASDGWTKVIMQAPFAHGLIQAGLLAEIVNNTS